MAFSPHPAQFEKEHRMSFRPASPDWIFVVFSGSVGGSLMLGGEKDDAYTHNEMEIIVGPWWRDVQSVVPFVAMTGFDNADADDDDEQGWSIEHLTWDTVGGTGPNVDEERIRLKFWVDLKGENSRLTRISYTVTAAGRELGSGGIDAP